MTSSERNAANVIAINSQSARNLLESILLYDDIFPIFSPADRRTLKRCQTFLLRAIHDAEEALHMGLGIKE